MGDVKYPAGSDGTEPLEKEPGPGAARLVLLVLLYGGCQAPGGIFFTPFKARTSHQPSDL